MTATRTGTPDRFTARRTAFSCVSCFSETPASAGRYRVCETSTSEAGSPSARAADAPRPTASRTVASTTFNARSALALSDQLVGRPRVDKGWIRRLVSHTVEVIEAAGRLTFRAEAEFRGREL